MDLSHNGQDTLEYLLPARQLTGTRADVLHQIDELIQGLVGLRQLVSIHHSDRAERSERARGGAPASQGW